MTQEQVAVTAEKIRAGKTSLGIEFGSTRIKAVLIDDAYHTIAAGDYEWASHLEDGLCSPPSPSAASSTAKPSRSRLKRSNWRISFSSSITSMRCMESSFALEK